MTGLLVYLDGRCLPSHEATIPVNSAGVRYGTNVFEGICLYTGPDGTRYLFRAAEHLDRLAHSLKVTRIEAPYEHHDYLDAMVTTLDANDLRHDAHLRLSVVVRGEGRFDTSGPTSLVCVVTRRPSSELDDRVQSVATSSWRRIDDLSLPPRVKAGPNYANSRLALLEAQAAGYDDALLLNRGGTVAEATASCLMIVRGETLVTAPVTAGLLESITRATLLELGKDLGLAIQIRPIDRTEVYTADEAFLCNSFEEVRPIRSLDGIELGRSKPPGPVTRALWDRYEAAARGRLVDYRRWLQAV